MKIGTTLNLTVKDRDSNQVIKSRCKIIGENEKYLFIDYPINIDTQQTCFLFEGTTLEVTYLCANKNLFHFQTKVEKRVKQTIPALAILIPEDCAIKQIQRREYVRINTAIDIAIHSTDGTFTPYSTVTADISGGGMSAVIPFGKEIKKGEKLTIWVVLHTDLKTKYIHVHGEMIQMKTLKNGLQTASIKFRPITNQTRQDIIQFCFEKQREARKKELI